MNNEVRSQAKHVQALVERRSRLEAIARTALGDAIAVPLVERMLYWLGDDELATALEDIGALQSGKAEIITLEQVAKDMLAALQRNLK